MDSYSIITPVKDEKGNIEHTISSVVNQLQLPVEWIIVDDNSSDGTDLILNDAARRFDWITIVKAENIDSNDYSSRVVQLFDFGYSKLRRNVEFVSKLDADVSFTSDFYFSILKEFDKNPQLGIASGHLTIGNVPEKLPITKFVCTRGATKVYRLSCLKDIGGIVSFQGWDTLDNVAARAKGWDVEIIAKNFEHLKKEGSKVGNRLYSHFRTGYYNGAIPYLWIYFFLKIIYVINQRPYFVGSLFQLAGYCKARLFSRRSPFPNYVVKQLHKEQFSMLTFNFFK